MTTDQAKHYEAHNTPLDVIQVLTSNIEKKGQETPTCFKMDHALY